MACYSLDPLTDPRWDRLLARSHRSSVFHSRAWLQALAATYGYRPIAFTTSSPREDLQNGLVLCYIESWITGRRLVSLPFSDHCDILSDDAAEEAVLLDAALSYARKRASRWVEIRPASSSQHPDEDFWQPLQQFYIHDLSLEPEEQELYSRLHVDCIRRKIRRAERERLSYSCGQDELLLQQFYRLLVQTRRRHGVPPPPDQWFRNLSRAMGRALKIRVASKNGHPVAALLSLEFQDSVTYKYGCSDEKHHNLGGTPFLFWKLMQEARRDGMMRLDLGRSDMDNPGLIEFKERLGARRAIMMYWRSPSAGFSLSAGPSLLTRTGKSLFRIMPRSALIASGNLLYRHAG